MLEALGCGRAYGSPDCSRSGKGHGAHLRMFTTPRGMPASTSTRTRLKVESGVSCAGLMTQVLPQTIAGSSFQEGIAMGKFHGVIMPQMPMGWRTAIANLLGNSEGVVGPNSRRPSPAM